MKQVSFAMTPTLSFAMTSTLSFALTPTLSFAMTPTLSFALTHTSIYTVHIKVNGPILFKNSNQITAALDFWHKAGYSSSEAVFGKKPEPVCQAKVEEYLEYNDGDSEDESQAKSDYKRRIKRQKSRQRLLKHLHANIFDIMADRDDDDGL